MLKTLTKTKTLSWMKLVFSLFFSLFLILTGPRAQAKSSSVRKVQEVNFAELNMKGTIRNPDGAYLVQKRGIKFMPLYDVQKDMDSKIRDSVQYVR